MIQREPGARRVNKSALNTRHKMIQREPGARRVNTSAVNNRHKMIQREPRRGGLINPL